MLATLTSALLAGAALVSAAQELVLRPGATLRVELSSPDPASAPGARRLALATGFSGTLYVRAAPAELGATLRVEDEQGRELARDDYRGVGSRAACLSLPVEPDGALRLIVSARSSGTLELDAIAAPESAATRAAASAAREAQAEVARLRAAGEPDRARELLVQTLRTLREVPGGELSEEVGRASWALGRPSWELGAIDLARAASELALRHRVRCLPEDHPELQVARANLALTLREQGDLDGARALQERVLEVRARSLPEDDPDLLNTREHLAALLRLQGEPARSRRLLEQVVEVRSRTLPEDDPQLQATLMWLATALMDEGELQRARELLQRALEVFSQKLSAEHPYLDSARGNLAIALFYLGDLRGACALEEQVLAERLRTLSEDHPGVQQSRENLAGTLRSLGDLRRARELQEQVLEVRARTLVPDSNDLQGTRLNLALTVLELGDPRLARELAEQAVSVLSRTMPEEHPAVQRARQNLAVALIALGDLPGARELQERVLAIRSRTQPDDDLELQRTRCNLAGTLQAMGDPEGAKALLEHVVATLSPTLAEDHPDLQNARTNLATTLRELGDEEGARALLEEVNEIYGRTASEESRKLQFARLNLAISRKRAGELGAARELEERALAGLAAMLPDDHDDLMWARRDLARTLALAGEGELAQVRAGELARALRTAARHRIASFAPREAEAWVEEHEAYLSTVLCFASRAPDAGRVAAERAAFELVEGLRGVGLAAARVVRAGASDPELDALRAQAAAASRELVRLAQAGAGRDRLSGVRSERDRALRELLVRLGERLESAQLALWPDLGALSSTLGEREALVGYRRYMREEPPDAANAAGVPSAVPTECLLAFVVRPDGTLQRIELGSLAAIEQRVGAWRAALAAPMERGVGVVAGPDPARAAGEALRRAVLDPLAPALEGVERVIVASDDVLHAVPLEALPDSAGPERPGDHLVGERLAIELRSTLWELLAQDPAEETPGAKSVLLALGNVDYYGAPRAYAGAADQDEPAAALPALVDGAVVASRAGAWERVFRPLPATEGEVRAIARLFVKSSGEGAEGLVLEEERASRAALEELAPRARFLHVATHGWFAPESIASSADPEPLDARTGLGLAMSREEQVRASSPLVLCGLALAGANLPPDALGRVPGVITAEELATLDLSGCELAVLSACDTNVGVRRAGQGVASLQRALHMAGARSVITSLWRVPDEATRELMIDFYRRLFMEGKPKARALWEAKLHLRAQRDEQGLARYSTRDWAAWVLTGDAR